MIKRYCDNCGKEIVEGSNHAHFFEVGADGQKVGIIVSQRSNGQDVCLDCTIAIVAKDNLMKSRGSVSEL